MNEVKTPKKPLLYYYSIALLLLLLFNFLAMPRIAERRVQEVDYGTFMTMAENKEIGQVEVQETENRISRGQTVLGRQCHKSTPGLTERDS